MAKVDEILQELSNTVFQHGKATRTNIPFHYGEPMKDAKQALYKDLLEMIDNQYQGDDGNGNEFVYTDDLRTKLKDYFGIKE